MDQICLVTKAWRYSAGWLAQLTAQAIAESGQKIIFIAPEAEPTAREPSHPNLTRFRLPRELPSTHSRTSRILASLARIWKGQLAILMSRGRSNRFIFSIPEPLAFTLPIFAILRLSGAKVIFIVHDVIPHAWSLPSSFRFIERVAHCFSYRLASSIVTLAPATKLALANDFSIPLTKIHVIPHGPLSIGDISVLPGNAKLLIFGALRRNKSVLEVIEAVISVRDAGCPVVLILAGEPLKQEGDYWKKCLHVMSQDPSGFDVREGFVHDQDVPDLVAEVDAFVLAYQHFDSQSGVGVLAALAGRPVIGTLAGGLSELYAQGMVGPQIHGDVTSVSVRLAIIEFFATGYETWNNQASMGAQQVASVLKWDVIARQYVNLAYPKGDRDQA